MNATTDRNAFLARLSELEGSSPQIARGVREALRNAEKHDCFEGARFERMMNGPGLVLSFRLGPCNIERYFSPYQLTINENFCFEVQVCVESLLRQRRSLTYGTFHANSKTAGNPAQGNQTR